jgi:hypothetical protein
MVLEFSEATQVSQQQIKVLTRRPQSNILPILEASGDFRSGDRAHDPSSFASLLRSDMVSENFIDNFLDCLPCSHLLPPLKLLDVAATLRLLPKKISRTSLISRKAVDHRRGGARVRDIFLVSTFTQRRAALPVLWGAGARQTPAPALDPRQTS